MQCLGLACMASRQVELMIRTWVIGEHSCFYLFGFYVAFNTVQVISRWVVGRAEETSNIHLVKVLYCKLPTNGKQLPAFHLRPCQEPNPGLRGGRRECYHSAGNRVANFSKNICYSPDFYQPYPLSFWSHKTAKILNSTLTS